MGQDQRRHARNPVPILMMSGSEAKRPDLVKKFCPHLGQESFLELMCSIRLRACPPPSSIPPYLGDPAGPLHVDPVALPIPDDPAPRTLPIYIFLDVADLFPFAPVIEAMHDSGCIAQERAHDPRLDNHAHRPDLRYSG